MDSKKSYSLLEQAMKTLPAEHSFSPARLFIKKALQEIVTIETKRAKKKETLTPHEKWNIDLQTGSMVNPWQVSLEQRKNPMATNPLKAIDEMIKQEYAKIENIKAKQHQGKPNENMGTILD